MLESGLAELVRYGNELAVPNIVEADNVKYTDKKLYEVNDFRRAEAIKMSTLTSLIDYIKSDIDMLPGKMLIHVVSPTEVMLVSALDGDRKREILVDVNAMLPTYEYGRYIGHENFIIALQSKFIPTNDSALLLKFAGTVEDGTVAQYGDDGVTQKAVIKTGIASKEDVIVPNPVYLIPYRTFMEIEQCGSEFIFRMKQGDGVNCALFEADGGAWKNSTVQAIKNYLNEELEGCKDRQRFTVIA